MMKEVVYITAIALTVIGFMALTILTFVKFVYVVPFMRRRRGNSAIIWGLIGSAGLGLHQDLEYYRLARDGDSAKHRRVAFIIKIASIVFFVSFLLMMMVVLIDLYFR